MRGLEQVPWLYDTMCAVMERFGFGRWRRWLVAGARGLTLDLGCGTGRNLPLYPAGVRAIGLEPCRATLERARGRAPGVPLVQGSAEVRRVLRQDGRLRMLEHVRSTRPWKGRFQDRSQPLWTWLSGGCHPNRDTERTVEACGFAIEAEGRRAKGDMRRFSARPVQ